MANKFKVIELFGGIGACTTALKRIGIDFEVVDYVEIDKYAVASYNAINGTNFKPQDVKEWNKDLKADLIMHGSPCQDFSIAGRQQGGDEGSGTRSSLMFETIRIVEKVQPRYVIWENVRNVISEKHRRNFDKYLSRMQMLGYRNYWKVLNAKNYGVPQNRERVFVVSVRDFIFPEPIPLELRLKDLLEKNVDEKYFLSDKGVKYATDEKRLKHKFTDIDADISLTITANGQTNWTGSLVTDRPICTENIYGQVTGVTETETENLRIRKLTPKECWRLMGFTDEEFSRAREINSDTQLYKQAGNSIVVDVLEAILRNLLTSDRREGDQQLTLFEGNEGGEEWQNGKPE